MENTNIILENTTIHNANLTEKYISAIKSNFVMLFVIYGVFTAFLIVLGLTGTEIAWIALAVIAICFVLMMLMNYRGLKASKEALSKFEGAVYHYKFYETTIAIEYEFNGKSDSDSIRYTQIKQYLRNNGLFAFNLPDNTILFIDEMTVEDKEKFEEIVKKIASNCQETLKNSRKKRRKNK